MTESLWARHVWPEPEGLDVPKYVALVRRSKDGPETGPFHVAEVRVCAPNLFRRADEPDHTVEIEGDVKWDGCSNWTRDEGVMLHFCSADDLIEWGRVLAWAHGLAQDLIRASGTAIDGEPHPLSDPYMDDDEPISSRRGR